LKTKEEFIVLNTENENTTFIGNETLMKSENKTPELTKLQRKFNKLFDGQPGEGINGIE
jgi:hypothetical protein